MARSGSKRRNRAASAYGQEADIAVLAIDPHFQGYGTDTVPRGLDAPRRSMRGAVPWTCGRLERYNSTKALNPFKSAGYLS